MSPERPPKVFISYSHDSAEHEKRVLAFANRLGNDGIDVVLDQYVSPPPASWPRWMEAEMDSADFIVVICSKDYLAKVQGKVKKGTGKGVKWESLLSYQQTYDNDSNSAKFIPVLLEGGEYEYIPTPMRGGNHYRLSDDKEYEKLLRHITNQPETPKPEPGPAKKLPPRPRPGTKAPTTSKPWNVPHSRNDAFTGREQILTDLRADLLKKGKQALFGLGGVGKTQIAVEYAWRHRDEYTAVLWCFVETEQSVRGGYAAIAALLDLPEKESQEQAKVTEAVKHWLEQNSGWLLVLDNADDPAMLKPFLPQQGKGHTLLTSRAYSFQKIGLVSPREINVLSPGEAREFLLRRTGREATEKSTADALAKELGHLPLALEQAAAYIAETGTSFSSYLAGYRKQGLKLLEKQGPVMGNDEKEQQKRTVATTWALNFADVEKNSPASADLLRLSAFLAPDAIPLDLLEKGAEGLPKLLAEKVAEASDNPLTLDELLSPLLRYSLVRRNEETRSYSIHPLVQEAVREGQSSKTQKTWVQHATSALAFAFPDPQEFKNWPNCDQLMPHAQVCAEFVDLHALEMRMAGHLSSKAGYYLFKRGQYVEAELQYRRAFAIDSKVLGPEHSEVATDLNNLAGLYRAQGHDDDAEPLYRQALAIRETKLGPKHLDTASGLNNLAVLYFTQGKFTEAEPLFRRALEIQEEELGPEHPVTATTLNNLAALYRGQGRTKDVEPLYLRALGIDEEVLGPDHPDTAIDLSNLSALYYAQGRYDEAIPLARRALNILEKALGAEHPSTALVRNNLILLYRQQGKNVEADALVKGTQAQTE
jgi:tetratricopeptide (TPR) repeat protein